MLDFQSPQIGVAVIAGLVAILTSMLTAFITSRIANNKMLRDFKLDFATESVARELLMDKQWRLRSFGVIKQHLGGFEDDALRQVLVKAGAVRFKSRNGAELWGLLSRNRDRLSLEWIDDEPGYRDA